MPEKILIIDNSTFFVICRISGEELQDVQDIQWFLAGDNQKLLADQTCQSVIPRAVLACTSTTCVRSRRKSAMLSGRGFRLPRTRPLKRSVIW